ncbi:MAG: glucose/quinate/shikimate family membrane-bound PQQ-dependent dehydrogenase [Acetobacterales bacterium]
MLTTVSGFIFAALGVALAVGGVWLVAVGGSWYYVAAAVGFLVTGSLLIARRAVALWVYAAVVLGTLVWALWEVGLDWWQLAPRGWVVVLLGVWLVIPGVLRGMRDRPSRDNGAPLWRGAGLPLTLAIALGAVVAVAALVNDPHDQDGRLRVTAAAEGRTPGIPDIPPGEWHAYGRTGHGTRYAPLGQITPANAGELERVWHFRTGDTVQPGDPTETTYQVTPLKIGDMVYICTPHNWVMALDPATGEELWRFDPEIPPLPGLQHRTCRGVSYHAAAEADASDPCSRRLFLPTADARLIALSAETGEICPGFGGEDGTVDLWHNMPSIQQGFYYSTSPPVVAGNLIIVGGAVNDNVDITEPSGVIRAYDVNTGELVWNWDPGNPEQTEPIGADQTYTPSSPNSWSIASVDQELGMVYLPFGNQPPDQWGGNRDPAVEKYSSSIVALDLESGAVRWVFQTVHHDLWDMDVPSQPSLLDIETAKGTVPALVQPTKQGDVYVLDRRNGEPILPVEEVPAPQGAAEGDYTAPTQPVSALSFQPPPLSGSDMWGASMFDQLVCRIRFRSLRYEGRYTPPSTQGTIVYPGNFGVFNWGSVAVDPVSQTVFATPSYLAFEVTLIPRENERENYVSEGNPGFGENYGAPFAARMQPFLSPLGLPCQAPPWGYVAGADLRTGDIAWMRPNGTVRDRAPVPLPFRMGVPDLGGPLMTAGGVAFNSGTLDYYVRAYDIATGEQLWQDRLPAGGQATPMSYEHDGRQYVLVVAGGHGSLGTRTGDSVIAYALP